MTPEYFLHFVTPFGFSMFITLILVPLWITICRKWNLFDEPDNRKHHASNIPSMGGIAIFAGIFISFLVFADIHDHDQFRYLFGATVILFFTGFFDDLMTVPMINKLLIQIASSIVVFYGGFRVADLHGVLWIHEIPEWLQLPVTLLLIVAFTNAYNFIDGSDGLAGMLGVVISAGLGMVFLVHGAVDYAVLSLCLTGALIGFLFFNFAPASIFMGDTGSLVIGFILAVCSVEAMSLHATAPGLINIPAFMFALLLVPLYDIARVFLVRISNGSSPFMPDRSHLHHVLLRHHFGHRTVSIMIPGLTLLLITLSFATPLIPLNMFILLCILVVLTLTNRRVLSPYARLHHRIMRNAVAEEAQSDS
jgi:UDP-N-acetylmuramyl pentapeptide phosphotransferase/UDP-N-acetylglucosamine-1-phosphate transferase